ncbi:IPT/TIG domain-containing protein [Portibacter lacus]|uniref:IPT/TIG domain-containing protein n=1 Tax=Portibacter lacus TaxID=1099794 RepID=A0AA37SR38_9BACT|nr:IPT/TIG domain-containing protein [Portibacter lacus]GLR18199.1 hypothetical protein GCM10007940_28140 [Portibacter lacus]
MKGTNMTKNLNYIVLLVLLISCGKGEPPVVTTFEPDFGFEETLIVVEGMNFDDVIAINFNDDVPADFNPSYGTETALLFRVPEKAPLGENMVKIVTLDGETHFPFRVTLEPPEITKFGPTSANTGDIVTIQGENFFEPLEVLFFDSIPGNIIFKSPDSIKVEVPAGVTKGRLKVKANGGDAYTSEVFFTTKNILINDFDGNGVRSETDKWLFYGNIDQNAGSAIHQSNPAPIDGNFLKISGVDPGSIWIGGTESNANDVDVFDVFNIESNINNTFFEMDLNSNNAKDTYLIIVLTERGGSPNDFTETIHVDWDGWQKFSVPLNRFNDVSGASIDPSKIKNIKLHLYNELGVTKRLQVNVDNLKFVQIN